MDILTSLPFAHRGYHNAARGIIENSPSAFEAAVRAGYAIEVDVVLSSDGEAIAFHDVTLDRVTRETGKVRDRSAAEITQILLEGSADTIPTLADVLDLIKGRVPLLVEIKNASRHNGALEGRVAKLLDGYGGPVAIQSFNPYSLAWFASERPEILRGQISQDFFRTAVQPNMPAYQKFFLTNLLLSGVSRPNFVSYAYRFLPAFAVTCAAKMGMPILGWTVKDEATAESIAPYVDNIIFEGFGAALTAQDSSANG